ncbi:MAG: DUF4422 domain-containing protein [Ruminococcus flavefaciens]|nr:DUF4422 domain-containing protein [Ruminococcus flavefaciens]
MDIKILIATHKKYRMPEDDMYLPVQVGAEGKQSFGFQGDNVGENISSFNPRMCELTAVYWAWKNLKADYIGFVHYRRHFTIAKRIKRLGNKDKFQMILSREEAENILKQYDLILPNKRRYYIESIRSHFIHLPYTYEKDLKVLEETIKALTPEYLGAYETVMNRRWAHMFNMFIIKKEYFDKYCEWMFPILQAVDKRIDVTGYTPMEARAVAYFGEFMMDIWNEKNRIAYEEVDVMFMEKQSMLKKAWTAFMRKLIYAFNEKRP